MSPNHRDPSSGAARDGDDAPRFDSTIDILGRARNGDGSAARILLERMIVPLRRWARGRLPGYARAGADTEDVVQDAVVRAIRRIDAFEHRTVGGLQAYLRESVLNRIRDEIRRVGRHGIAVDIPERLSDNAPSPLEQAILRERSERYLEALRQMRPEERIAIIFRLEHGYSFAQLATKLGKPSADAARMMVSRALERLGSRLGVQLPDGPTRPGASDADGRGVSGRARKGA